MSLKQNLSFVCQYYLFVKYSGHAICFNCCANHLHNTFVFNRLQFILLRKLSFCYLLFLSIKLIDLQICMIDLMNAAFLLLIECPKDLKICLMSI